MCFVALDKGGLQGFARNSLKSTITLIFENDPFASLYTAIGERKKSLTADFYRSSLKMV